MLLIGVEWLLTITGGEGAEASSRYLFFGLEGASRLTPWIWSAIVLGFLTAGAISWPRLRERPGPLAAICVSILLVTWIEKTMGLVVAGFIPTPMGEIFEYMPNLWEIAVSLGVVAIGGLIFLLLARVVILIDAGELRLSEPAE